MKVILTTDVKNIGRAHDVVTVSDGHALNLLIPKKLAVAATGSALKEAKARKEQAAVRKDLDAKLIAQNFISLSGSRVVVTAKANEKGHLYTAIGAPEIVDAVKKSANIDLPENAIRLEKPIKEVGTFEIPVASGEAFGKFSLTVEAA